MVTDGNDKRFQFGELFEITEHIFSYFGGYLSI